MNNINTLKSQVTLPIVAAPMFLISGPQLVIECCKAGIVGTFPALNQRSTEGFEEWVVEIKETLAAWEAETGKKAAPFGVNLIVHHSNPRIQADLQVCMKHKVPLIITSLGAVKDLVNAVHSYGGLVFHDVIKKRHAEKAAEAGVDGLILVSAGAGGHGGTLNPMPFVQEVKTFFKGVILLAGGISTGRDVASALQMGADFAYMGTRFINTYESKASEEYRNMIIEAGSSDIIYTAAVSGVNANFLSASLAAAGFTKEQLSGEQKQDLHTDLGEEAKAWKTIWSAGQGSATIHKSTTVNDLVAEIKSQFREAVAQQQSVAAGYLDRQ